MGSLANYQPLFGAHLNVLIKEGNYACSQVIPMGWIYLNPIESNPGAFSKSLPDFFRSQGHRGHHNQRKQRLRHRLL